jgi:ABC-type sugar transport system ATPase subunit
MDILKVESIKKRFPGVNVLNGISFSLEKGNIYGLVGENGAGKSTLVKILMGIYPPDDGEVFIEGEQAHIKDPLVARNTYKIDAVFQEHALIPQMSVAENIFLDELQEFYMKGFINKKKLQISAKDALKMVGLELDVSLNTGELSEGDKSLVELSKALFRNPKILIFDEMTAPLPSDIVKRLFQIIRELKESGKTIIFISHRLGEVLTICDEIIVLKDGILQGIVNNRDKGDISSTRKKIIRMMTGTEKGLDFPEKKGLRTKGETVLSLRDIRNECIRGVSLDVRKGEIVALAGLRGQGQSELLRAISGLLFKIEGDILINDEKKKIRNPREAMDSGIFYISDKRDEEELWLTHDVMLNISVVSVGERTRMGIIQRKREQDTVQRMVSSLRIETPSLAKIVRQLSGGNRQKVVLGKYLLARPKILLLDQPTKGLDVGSKVEIYHLLRKLTDEGIPTLAVLTDLEEVVNLPDRIFVMHEGSIVKEFSEQSINQEELLDSYYG